MDQQIEDRRSDDLSLRELILKVRKYGLDLWQKKYWIIGIGLVTGLIWGYLLHIEPTTYRGQISYMMNENNAQGASASSSIISQLGGGGAEFNYDRIIAISQTRRVICDALLDTANIQGRADLLANHLIDIYDYHGHWKERGSVKLADFYFTSTERDSFSRTENRVINQLYGRVTGRGADPALISTSYSQISGILKLSGTTTNEALTYHLVTKIYNALSKFYVDNTIERQRFTLNKLLARTDSINRALQAAEYQLANYEDRNLGLIQRRDAVARDRLLRDVQSLSSMYGEALRNKENARFMMHNARPYFQIIDDISYPLPAINPKFSQGFVNGLLTGSLLGVFVFLTLTIFRDVMTHSE